MIFIFFNTVLMLFAASYALTSAVAHGWIAVGPLYYFLAFAIGFCVMAFYYVPAIKRIKEQWDEENRNNN